MAIAPASEPAPASVRANAMSVLPAARSGSQRAFCWSVPAITIGSAASSWTARMSPVVAHARAELLDRQAGGQQVGAEPAVLGRERQPEDVLGGEEVLEVPRELGRPVDLGGPGRDPLTGELADGVAELALLVGEAVRGRLGCRGHVAAS